MQERQFGYIRMRSAQQAVYKSIYKYKLEAHACMYIVQYMYSSSKVQILVLNRRNLKELFVFDSVF